MFSTIYWVYKPQKGSLGTMARPRGYDWLEDEIKALKRQSVDILVSGLTIEETYSLGLKLQPQTCLEQGIKFINYPIEDRQLPDSTKRFHELTMKLAQAIENGQTVVTHCRMGIGRASMLAIATMIVSGINLDTALHMVTKARGLSVPDTPQQLAWLKHFSDLYLPAP